MNVWFALLHSLSFLCDIMRMSSTENSMTKYNRTFDCFVCNTKKTGMGCSYVGRELISVTQQKLLLPNQVFQSEKKSDRESFSISATSGIFFKFDSAKGGNNPLLLELSLVA